MEAKCPIAKLPLETLSSTSADINPWSPCLTVETLALRTVWHPPLCACLSNCSVPAAVAGAPSSLVAGRANNWCCVSRGVCEWTSGLSVFIEAPRQFVNRPLETLSFTKADLRPWSAYLTVVTLTLVAVWFPPFGAWLSHCSDLDTVAGASWSFVSGRAFDWC